jgi:hypothetical protein
LSDFLACRGVVFFFFLKKNARVGRRVIFLFLKKSPCSGEPTLTIFQKTQKLQLADFQFFKTKKQPTSRGAMWAVFLNMTFAKMNPEGIGIGAAHRTLGSRDCSKCRKRCSAPPSFAPPERRCAAPSKNNSLIGYPE